MEWEKAKDVQDDIKIILGTIDLSYIDISRIYCYRTRGAKARAYARTWAMPKIFQDALEIRPAYVIEVITKYYDKLDKEEKIKVLIHELLHIPKNFSGALLPHKTRNRNLHTVAKRLFKEYKERKDL